ncbi:hypothetical protein KAR91_78955, partial [Candidatus Pacearchaeota archaeon]|nr:hypothetical protein [Candidatus Pacearchaeota archaeon]
KIMFVFMIIFPLMALGKEIDCKKANYIFNFKHNTVEDTLSEEERVYCDKLEKEIAKKKEIERAQNKLNEALEEKTQHELVLPILKRIQNINKNKNKAITESKYGFLDENFYLILFGINYALKEINSTEIVNDITITLGNFKKGLIKNGYTEEQAMQVITALLGTKAIPVDL